MTGLLPLLPVLLAVALLAFDVLADIWNGLKAGLRALAGIRPPQPAPPQVAARTPCDPRQGLDPADPASALLLGTCPVCGMDDPERFELGVATATWRGWPAHDTCVAWLGDDRPAAESGVSYVPCTLESHPAAAFEICVPERADPVDRVIVQERGTRGAGIRPYLKPEQPSWSVSPGAGMSVCITARLAGSTHRALAVLGDADAAFPRTDLICWHSPARYDLTLLAGDPALLATPPALPPGAEIVAWVGIPARCTQITPAMIRCALPSELPGLR